MRDLYLLLLARLILSRPRAVLLCVLVVVAIAAAIVPGLRVEAGHSALVAEDNVHQQRFERFLTKFGSPNLLLTVVQGGNEQLRRQAVDLLMGKLPARSANSQASSCEQDGPPNQPGCVRDVLGRINLEAIKPRALLFLPEQDLQAVVTALTGEGLGLDAVLEIRGLASAFEAMADEIGRRAMGPLPTGAAREQARTGVEVMVTFLDEIARRIQDPERAAVPLQRALVGDTVQSGIDAEGYLSSPSGDVKVAMIRPVNDSDEPKVVVPLVRYVQRQAQLIERRLTKTCTTEGSCPDGPLRLQLTGLPAVIADETEVVNRDVLVTTVVAIAGIFALFIFGFRSVRQSIFGLAPLLTGLLWTLAFVRLAFGELNLVTAAFIATLLGLGIDFGVHLLSRFNELRRRQLPGRRAVEGAIRGAGPGILTGALTTAGAFVALAVNDFLAFSQLGIITGVGLLLVLIATLTLQPAMLALPALQKLQGPPPAAPPACPVIDFPGLVVRRPWVVTLACVALASFMVIRAQQIPWSYDYLALMPEGRTSVTAMSTLSEKTDFSGNVCAVVAGSVKEARELGRKIERKPTIRRVESLATFLPQNQEQKLKLLHQLAPELEEAKLPAPSPVDLEQLKLAVQDLSDALEDARFEARRGNAEKEAKLLGRPIKAVRRIQSALAAVPAAEARIRLQSLQQRLMDGLREGLSLLRANVAAEPLSPEDLLELLPPGLRDRLYHQGQLAVYAYPAHSIANKEFLGQLVADLQSISASATGFPVTHWETSRSIEEGFRDASVLAGIVLLIMLMIDFRSIRFTLLAVAPLAMGVVWMWGGISLLGIDYNYVNIIAFPLIIGIGVASGVHILHRYRQEGQRDVAPVVRFTGMAVFLSAATTMVGFGSLALAQHRGAASLGLVLLLGVGSCLVTSCLFLPALLEIRRRRRPQGDRPSTGPPDE